MNIILSCGADRKKSRGAFIISKGGKREVEESFFIPYKSGDETLKEYLFESLIRGLRRVRSEVQHEDLLLIELPNGHMVEWLNGSKEYKDYSKYLDEVVDIIDTIDCRYLFTKSNVKNVKKLLEVKETVKVQGVLDAFADM